MASEDGQLPAAGQRVFLQKGVAVGGRLQGPQHFRVSEGAHGIKRSEWERVAGGVWVPWGTSQDNASSSGPGYVPRPQDGACTLWSSLRACGFARCHSLSDDVITWGWAAAARGPAPSDMEGQQRRGRCVPPCQGLPVLPSPALRTTHRRLLPGGFSSLFPSCVSSWLQTVLGGAEQGPNLAKTHPFLITISEPEATRVAVGIPGLWAVQGERSGPTDFPAFPPAGGPSCSVLTPACGGRHTSPGHSAAGRVRGAWF